MKIINRTKHTTPKSRGSIRWSQIVNIAFKNLFYKKLRTSLTIAGVVIGIGAVVYLVAFGFGLRNLVTNQVVDSNSIRTIDVESAKSELIKLNEDTIKKVAQIQNVEEAAKVYNRVGKTAYEGAELETVLYSVDQKYLDLANPRVLQGAPPRFTKENQLFINSSYVKALGKSNLKDLVGKELVVTFKAPLALTQNNQSGSSTNILNLDAQPKNSTSGEQTTRFSAKISGILETGNSPEIYISSDVFIRAGVENASQLKVLVDDQSHVPDVQKKIEAIGLTTNSPLSTLKQINQVFAFLNLLFLGFGGIGLIIAVLGMFNTLTISLLERTKEIGLLITMGARRKDIRRLFIVEAVGLSLIGGILGTITAFVLSKLTDLILNRFARSRGVTEAFTVFSFKPALIFLVFGFSVVLGLLVVYFPAKRASNINPIEALRS